jgi:hypothetical protein
MTPRADRAYLDRPVDDRVTAHAAARHAARHWGLAEPTLLRVGMNAIFVTDDHVLRVGTPNVPAGASIDLAVFLADAGLRVPMPAHDDVVEFEDLSVTCWEWLRSIDAPVDWAGVGAMVARLHEIAAPSLPPRIPLPSPTDLSWWDFPAMLARVDPVLDAAARVGIEAAIDRHRGWKELTGQVVCHGDVHPGNVVMTASGAVLLDWDLLCWAPPGWDHAPLLTWAGRWGGDRDAYHRFAAGYGAALDRDEVACCFAELRLVAATLLRLAAAMADPAAMPEAERRLRYWRGDPDAPMWTAQ